MSVDEPSPPERDLSWHRARWDELSEILDASDPEAIITTVRELQLDALQDEATTAAAGIAGEDRAREVLDQLRAKIERLQDENRRLRQGLTGEGDAGDLDPDLRRQYRALQAIQRELGANDPDAAVETVRRLVAARDRMEEAQDQLEEAGLQTIGQALSMIDSMEAQLQELYGEKETVQRSEDRAADAVAEGGTFDQLQAMMAREEKLQRELGVSDPDEVVEMVEGLADQLEDLYTDLDAASEQAAAEGDAETAEQLDRLLEREQRLQQELGVSNPDQVANMVDGLAQQLEELYSEKESMERSGTKNGAEGDTFEQMQAMMAREEKLQRELGVSSPEEVVEMVEGLADQLEDLYANIDAASQQVDSDGQTGEKLERLLEREQRLQQELGISDPEQIADMVGGLADQLDDLYSARERLMELGADSPEDAANMMQSMREQLESLYETQERMSDQGVDSVDQALSMIDSMEEQLSDLYDERKKLLDKGLDPTGDTADQVAEMESRLQELSAEKEALQERRNTLEQEKETYESIVRSLQQEFGTADPEQLARLIRSMEEQLNEAYEEKEQDTASRRTHLSEAPAFVPDDVLDAIDRLSDDELDALPFGAVALDDRGTVQFINEAAADLPGLGHRIGQRSEAEGQNFFRDLAPGANNNLFRGRFTEGVREDALDVCFPYTFVNPKAPPANLIVHMYRGADHNWLFFEAA